MSQFKPTARSRGRRAPKRLHYDRETIYGVLDSSFMCHVGYVIDDQPYVTPTSYWRDGDTLFWHGSAASRMIKRLAEGVAACLTVSHFDGLVLARSGFHHSFNYRSVMAFGRAKPITDVAAKEAALEAFVERVMPGRTAEIRPASKKELKATTVVAMEIEEAAAKIRSGPPIDDEPDYDLEVWAGTVPLKLVAGTPLPDPDLKVGIELPDYIVQWTGMENN
jgi:hypothetical protein